MNHCNSIYKLTCIGADGKDFLLKLKADLNKAKNVKEQFGLAAKEYSQCPSAKNFGELGTFKQVNLIL